MRRLWMGAAALVVLAACENRNDQALGVERGQRNEPTVTTPGEPSKSAKADENAAVAHLLAVVQVASEGELDLAKLAQQRTQSKDVKDFASKMIDEHQRDVDNVKRLGHDKNIDVQNAIDHDVPLRAKRGAHEEIKNRLSGLSGAAFDAAYMQQQANAHLMMAKLADEAQSVTKDADLEGFFKTMSGQARDHEQKALAAIPKACGGGPTSAGAPTKSQPGKQSPQTEPGNQPGTQIAPGTDTGRMHAPGATPGEMPPGSTKERGGGQTTPPSTVPPERVRP